MHLEGLKDICHVSSHVSRHWKSLFRENLCILLFAILLIILLAADRVK